jgi:methylenetetrahydrofolate reductase (NADPH)
MVEYIIGKGEELSSNWQDLVAEFDFPQKNGFYLFQKDLATGLNLDKPAARTAKATHPPIYLLCRLAHATLFNPDSIVFKAFKPVAKFADSSPLLKSLEERFEHINKVVLFNCMNCGDCGLFDVAFLCPMSQCPKNQRNGPCGGSYEGWCEVDPDKKCVWVRAYERLKGHKEEDTIGDYIVPPCNWELTGTSSWLNFYLGRDHSAQRLGIEPPQPAQSADEAGASRGPQKSRQN